MALQQMMLIIWRMMLLADGFMLRPENLEPKAILAGLKAGAFYSS